MKRVVTIQDISCIGKCSLTVALPIISAMGVETAIIPTAILSTHTAFDGFTFKDLTNEINPIKKHWLEQKLKFDAIYTGYLGSVDQLEIVSDFIKDFKTDKTTVLVDPVMGDNGKLYSGFNPEFAGEMAKLCAKADIIVPNMTEASFLLKTGYKGEDYSEEYIKDMLRGLAALGPRYAVLTGVSFGEDRFGVMSYDSDEKQFYRYFRKKIPASFHGTGDIFASTCIGAVVNGFSLNDALSCAVDFTTETILKTVSDKDSVWYGVNFESTIPYLIERIKKK